MTGAVIFLYAVATIYQYLLGVTGVPTFLFESGRKVVGAQPLEYFRRVLEGFGAA